MLAANQTNLTGIRYRLCRILYIIISLTLLNNNFTRFLVHGEHGVEYIATNNTVINNCIISIYYSLLIVNNWTEDRLIMIVKLKPQVVFHFSFRSYSKQSKQIWRNVCLLYYWTWYKSWKSSKFCFNVTWILRGSSALKAQVSHW